MNNTRKRVLNLALPAMTEFILQMMIGVVDLALIGRLGATAMAASGLSWQLVWFGSSVLLSISIAATAVVARFVGRTDFRLASRSAGQCLLLSSILSLIIAGLYALFPEILLKWLNAKPEVIDLGRSYLKILAITFFFRNITMAGNSILRGAGDTKFPMITTGITNIINIFFAYTLIFGKLGFPNLGLNGSAIASVVSRTIGCLIIVGLLIKGHYNIKIHFRDYFFWDIPLIKRILRVGSPAFIEELFQTSSAIVYLWLVASLGTLALAAHQVALKAESFSYMPGLGFAVSAATLMGQSLGAKRKDLATKNCLESVFWAVLVMSFMGVIFYLIPHLIVRIFTPEKDVIVLGGQCLKIIALAQPIQAVMFVLMGSLRGAGDTAYTMKVTALGSWGVRITLTYLLAIKLGWGLAGAWWAMLADMFFRAICVAVRFAKGKWYEIKI